MHIKMCEYNARATVSIHSMTIVIDRSIVWRTKQICPYALFMVFGETIKCTTISVCWPLTLILARFICTCWFCYSTCYHIFGIHFSHFSIQNNIEHSFNSNQMYIIRRNFWMSHLKTIDCSFFIDGPLKEISFCDIQYP